jgi:hypothetical protein
MTDITGIIKKQSLVVTRILDAPSSWYGKHGPNSNTSCVGGDQKTNPHHPAKLTFASVADISFACVRPKNKAV